MMAGIAQPAFQVIEQAGLFHMAFDDQLAAAALLDQAG